MASITQLFDDLCEAHLPAATLHLGQRGLDRRRAKQSLRKVAYDVLFANLFQDGAPRLQPDAPRLPVRNKIYMLSFNLRVGGLGPEAGRLEDLVAALQDAPGCPLAEVSSALDLLVQLAGTGPPRPPPRRWGSLSSRAAGRSLACSGYDCEGLRGLEMDVRAQILREEALCQDTVQKMLQVMEAAPGTGLPTLGRFSPRDSCDKFDRHTQASLFGALVHSRTLDMDVRLDLPPVPDSADLLGLAIKVPQSIDQSEDEGFQSASNLTPDSQSEPSVTPDLDLWEAALTYEASKRRCWERIGWPPGHREAPYLTEAGRDAFDRFCRLCEEGLQVLGGSHFTAPQRILVQEQELVKDTLNVLIGVVSATFSLCQPAQAFVVRPGVYVSGASPESMHSLLSELAACGTYYIRLSHFSLQPVLDISCSKGLVFQAFTSGVRRYLQYYRACVLCTPPTLSLLTIGFLFKKLGRQLRYLAELCGVGAAGGGPRADFPTGVKLLSYLYQETLDNCSNEHYPVLLSLLKTSCEPYTRFIHDWVYSGVFRDAHGEFMIQVNDDYLSFRDKFYWTHGYVLISGEVEDCVPVFLKHIANDVYVCGKTINLLKLCCPRHYLYWSDVPVPRISVIFSLEELKGIEKDCAVYVGRMERVARYSSVSKEEKELRVEIAKQELIVHAREAASRVLSALSDRQVSEHAALDARKREQFQRLKEQFVRDQERRLVAKQEEADDDFSYARELRDREKRLQALEEELERKARQALVDHYSRLSAEAARREQKALWRLQRRRLGEARRSFLLGEQTRLQELLKDASEGTNLQLLDKRAPAEHLPAVGPGRPQALSSGVQLPGGGQGLGPEPAEASGATVGAEPFCAGLHIRDFLPSDLKTQQSGDPSLAFVVGKTEGGAPVFGETPPGEAPLLEQALCTISSDLPSLAPGEVPTVASSQPSQAQEYDFSTILRPAMAVPDSPESVQTTEGEEGPQLQGVTYRKLDSWVPKVLDLGLAEEGSNGTLDQLLEQTSEGSASSVDNVPETVPSRPRWSVHGHVSEANIKVGENVSEVTPSRPRWSVHGHVSEANIKVGENVSEVTPSRPRWSVHGHVSEASIKVGENVLAVAPSRPRWSVHGHVSEASIKVGENVLAVAPSRPRWSVPISQSHTALDTVSEEAELATSGLGQGPSGHEVQSHLHTQSPSLGQLATETVPALLGASPLQGSTPVSVEDRGVQAESCAVASLVPVTLGDCDSKDHGSEGLLLTWVTLQAGGDTRAPLEGLAERYHLEQYPDSFEALSEPPAAHLLPHILPRSFSFPAAPGAQPGTDETTVQLSELLTLPVLLKRSVSAPLAAHVSLVNKAAVDYFFVELHLETHLEALRHFLLMEDGEFAQSLSDLLFEKLGSGQSPGELLNPLALGSVLSKALQYSLHGDSPLAANLSFALKFLPEVFTPNAPDVLSCLELRYKVDWPLNIIITENCLSKYGRIFSFLLQLKLMMWTLKDIYSHLKRTALVGQAARSVQLRQLQLFKHEMQHFVKVIQGYIATQILHVTWCEFRNKLASVGTLEEIQRAHAEYLNKAVFRGLLTEKAAPVMNIIHSIFSLVLKFRSQLISQAWGPAVHAHGAEHPNFALMQQSYNTFKYYSHFLFKVVTKLVNRGYQPHLEDFLLRINFNNYYQDA
ncbi:PREDICTED: gamma-tubulin complex component 6 [Elephantulus edwardii]|uniref:gamma-tubulin complex component 6 n=1 Tax=Elephantulus edwardii TaxID=28737 RepID=UPI0003F065EF|nr:PREDICTED: gamma-tubulin complex component 6 [Elephantulus edwardii]